MKGDGLCAACHKVIMRKEIVEYRDYNYFHVLCCKTIESNTKDEEVSSGFSNTNRGKSRTYMPSDYNNPTGSESEPN